MKKLLTLSPYSAILAGFASVPDFIPSRDAMCFPPLSATLCLVVIGVGMSFFFFRCKTASFN